MGVLMKKIRSFFYFVVLLMAFLPHMLSAAELKQVRVGRQSPDTVRMVAHIDTKTDCKVFTLTNPNRVVIDFEGTTLNQKCLDSKPEATSFIKDVRLGEPKSRQTRVVLETDVLPQIPKDGFFLAPVESNGDWRYVLDLTAASSDKPLPTNQQPVKSKMKKPVIVLDAGHGGADPGAISYSGKYEKNVTLMMAKETKDALMKTGKFQVFLTRDRDKALALRERIRIAHNHEADLFISIHADSAKNKKAKGLSVYTISERASDKEAMALAERENKADIIIGMDLTNEAPEVSNILIDLAKRDTMDKSSMYADFLVDKMRSQVRLLPQAHRFAGFVVLKSPNIPSVLLEIGYLSNKEEEKLLWQKSYRAKLSKAIVEAAEKYFDNIYE